MPLYDFKCPLTQKVYEARVKSPEDLPVCACGIRTPHIPQRLPSAAPFNLKGDGWYKPGPSR